MPVAEGEGNGRLSYGVLIRVLKGEERRICFPSCLFFWIKCLDLSTNCIGLFNVMYLGKAPGVVAPLPYGCYCNIEDAVEGLLGTAAIWPGPIHTS